MLYAQETPPAFPDKFEYRHIKEDDLPSVDLSKYFDEMAEYIARGKAAGGILVHWYASSPLFSFLGQRARCVD